MIPADREQSRTEQIVPPSVFHFRMRRGAAEGVDGGGGGDGYRREILFTLEKNNEPSVAPLPELIMASGRANLAV